MKVIIDLRRKTVTVESSMDEHVMVLEDKENRRQQLHELAELAKTAEAGLQASIQLQTTAEDGAKHFICADCGKPFATEKGLAMHRGHVHKGKKGD